MGEKNRLNQNGAYGVNFEVFYFNSYLETCNS